MLPIVAVFMVFLFCAISNGKHGHVQRKPHVMDHMHVEDSNNIGGTLHRSTSSKFSSMNSFLRKRMTQGQAHSLRSPGRESSKPAIRNSTFQSGKVLESQRHGPGVEIITAEEQKNDLRRLLQAKKEYAAMREQKREVSYGSSEVSLTSRKWQSYSPTSSTSTLPQIISGTTTVSAPLIKPKTHAEGDLEDIETFTSNKPLAKMDPEQSTNIPEVYKTRHRETDKNSVWIGSFLQGRPYSKSHPRRARNLPKWEAKALAEEKRNPCKISWRFLDAEFMKNRKRTEDQPRIRRKRSPHAKSHKKRKNIKSSPCQMVTLMNSAEEKKQLTRRKSQ